ncbi:transcriptional regulatory protein WalR [Clostridium homopropionicum DSM 5847]|uniref:Stage 0 sporulation protein A homolog n=1 Tax=Clostridium homopropionicum DSM 5847 TaxID=1121318 RepID=A0A0L6ZAP7_9CLOT|nr:response regulator transcription factor [Clostridium homopropionicum]KOA20032.1 transcriptional regulatory protein WalR [Clostridium homopropionicum DSM 5847]SFG65294.1 DNA-binding response regulator, OmpR family, contains REC and winged-helix (wHTH) domain [Clostridium homopropionicum]
MSRRILIADDEKEIIELIELYLQKENYEVITAFNGLEAWEKVKSYEIDLAVIDIMMPGTDGYLLVRKIREKYNIPIIILSARNTNNDIILGLGLGADDYVSKPFDPLELLARIQSQLRRFYQLNNKSKKETKQETKIELKNIIMDTESCTIFKNGIEISLTYTEYKILYMLMRSPGRVFTKKQIFEKVWDDSYYTDDGTIMVHISNLRDKLEEDVKNLRYIKTVRGLGYKFEAPSRLQKGDNNEEKNK